MSGQRKKIIVIDDDPIAVLIGQKIVDQSDQLFSFQAFNSAIEFLESYDQGLFDWPDMLFVDINMPVMSGWELLLELNSEYSAVHDKATICMLSSSNHPEDLQKFNAQKIASIFFTKPFTIEYLEKALNYNSNFKTVATTGNT
jgi:CheY-like chemotaxis protein